MKNKLLISGLLLALGAYALSLYNAAKRLNFRALLPQNFSVANGAFSFEMPFVVLNDSNRNLPVSGYAFDIFVNGTFLAKAYMFNFPTIVPGENIVRGSRVVVPVFDLLNVVPDLRNNPKSVQVKFSGNVRLLELLTIPVPDFSMSFTIPKLSL